MNELFHDKLFEIELLNSKQFQSCWEGSISVPMETFKLGLTEMHFAK